MAETPKYSEEKNITNASSYYMAPSIKLVLCVIKATAESETENEVNRGQQNKTSTKYSEAQQ